jgi:aryl-alcohol dehydrogenase-like predicted oxidoreductase
MDYRMLGRTGIRVSAIGFGTWGIGGVAPGPASYGPTDDTESLNALVVAFERGITFYDTADVYGRGHSEELLARAFATKRHQVVIASKIGYVADYTGQDFSARHVRDGLEKSLKRLRTDYVDLYQLHSPRFGRPEEIHGLLEPLRMLKREGKIRSVGVSLRSPEHGIPVIACGIDAIQVNFNLMDQRARTLGVLDAAAKHGTGVIVRTPLASGFLSGPLDTATLDPRDHRKARSEEQLHRWQEGAELFAALNRHTSRTPAQLALQFCLAEAGVSTVVPGMMHVPEVEENVGTLTAAPMPDSARLAIQGIYARHEFFVR